MMGSFGKPFRPVFDPGVAVTPWWLVAGKTCVAVYQPKGAASLAASYVNLANPGTYDAALGVAPTWASATGWTFNGSTQYLTTGIVPASGWSMLARIANTIAWGGIVGATPTTSNGFSMRWFPETLRVGIHETGFIGNVAIATGNEVLALAGRNLYSDGVFLASGGGTLSTAPGLYIGAENLMGVKNYPFTGMILAVAIYSSTLTAGEVAAVSAAMAAL